MFLRYLFLFIYINFNININAKIVYPILRARVNILSNSYYIPAYYKHFINNISNVNSISDCMYNCQNHEYCRTAVYTSQLSICSLYEEYSFVGNILPSVQIGQSVLSFSFCPNDSISEPMYVCVGTPLKSPISIENLINQLLLATPTVTIDGYCKASSWSTDLLFLAPMWARANYAVRDVNQDYIEVARQEFVPGIFILSFDSDDYNYFAVVDSYSPGNLYLRSNSVNTTICPTTMRSTCMSDKYVVGIPYSLTNQTLYVYWKLNGSQAFILPAPIYGVVSCLIINEILFIVGYPPDPPIQSVPLQPLITINNYSVIISRNQCPQAFNPLKIDSSGRFFVKCSNNSIYNMLIFTYTGTILGSITHTFFGNIQLGIKATKYRFSLAGSDGVQYTYIYDF